MSLSETDSGTERLNELAHEFVLRLRHGEQLTAEQFAAEHPELAAEIQDLFPTLLLVERLDPTKSRSRSGGSPQVEETQCPSELGEYRVLRRIGVGGMGIVYEAVQESLGRHVALKVLSSRDAKHVNRLERFKREAQAAAQLHHTNIVPVFGVGEAEGIHFYAMQFIDGQSLDRVVAAAASPEHDPTTTTLGTAEVDYYRAVARIGAQAADALAYAHSGGVLHRDIKPANMLLDGHGTVWLTDFGLARMDGLSDLTMADEVIGTLRYIPPESFEGRTDARGDIYSLGLTLYELLTGQPAFENSSRAELVHRILHVPPRSPRGIDERIPRDLETVIAKAIAREPAHRYQAAADLAQDLQRFCADLPILTRRLSIAEHSWRWCRKNPVPAFFGSLAAFLLLAVAVVSTLAYFRESKLHDSLQVALERTDSAELQGRRALFASHISAATAARQSRRQGQRFGSLTAIREATRLLPGLKLPVDEQQARRDSLRDLAISCLALPDIKEVGDVPAEVVPDVFHRECCALRDATGTLIVKRWPGDSERARLPGVDQHTWFNFSPEQGVMVLVNQQAHTLHRWQFQDAAPTLVAQLRAHDGVLWDCQFSRDARRVLLLHRVNEQGLVEVLDWPSGQLCCSRDLPYPGEIVAAARLSPNGQLIAVIEGEYKSDASRVVRVIEVDTGGTVATFEHAASVESVAWHPDSQTLAVGLTDSNDILLWNVSRQEQVGALTDQRGGGPKLCVNMTGELLSSSSSWANALDIWHPYSRQLLLHMPSPLQFAWSTADGQLLGEARLASGAWHYAAAEPSSVVRTLLRNPMYGPVAGWREASIHRDGRLLAVGSNDGVSLFDLETGFDVGHLPVGYALHPCFIPATGDLLTYSDQGLFRWPVGFSPQDRSQATIGPPERLPCVAAIGTQVASDRTGRVVAVAAGTTAVILHDSGQRVITLDSLTDCRKVAVSPDGRWVVTASQSDGPIDIWDGDSGAPIRRLGAKLAESDVCFSPDSELLAFQFFSPRVLRTGTWQEQLVPDAPDIAISCFSPDGQLVIGLSALGATLRELRTGRKLGTLDLPDSPIIWHSTFTPDGCRAILSSNERHAVYVWDLCQLNRELSDLGLGWDAPSIPLATPAATNQLPAAPLVVKVQRNAD